MLQAQQKIVYLVLLRWIALAGMSLTLLAARHWLPDFPIHTSSYSLLLIFGLSNLLLHLFKKRILRFIANHVLTIVLLADVIFLTLLLKLNGGSHNPFTILFLAIASVGALLLGRYGLVTLISSCLGGLWLVYSQFTFSESHDHSQHMMVNYPFHLQGMWLANSIGVFLICGWIFYLRKSNETMVLRHDNTQKILANIEKIESIGRIAAQAAHHINTPLGTLQLGLSEMKDNDHPLSEDERQRWLADMQHAVNQISDIIHRIKPDTQPAETAATEITTDLFGFIEEWTTHWSSPRRLEIMPTFSGTSEEANQEFLQDVGTALTALLDNALEAASDKPVNIGVSVMTSSNYLHLGIADNGLGMNEETKQRALDPLFTTKPTGTGLGLYVCQQIVHKYSGKILIDSHPNKGTHIKLTLTLPKENQ